MQNKWLQITSGQGPEECCLAVSLLAKEILKSAKQQNIGCEIIEKIDSDVKNNYKSVLLSIKGKDTDSFIAEWQGSVLWIAQSPYRLHHKRKNWFVGVEAFNPPDESQIKPNEIKTETFRSPGAGGQHVNKTESGVRLTHKPTGLQAIATEERSQLMNRKLALARLYNQIQNKNEEQYNQLQQKRWMSGKLLERGNPVKTFKGSNFVVSR